MPTIFRSILYLFFLFFLNPFPAVSQTYNFQNYSVEDGLPFVNVVAIYQDNQGYLWSGGYGGLSRFDGFKFVNYGHKDGMINTSVKTITGDKYNNLWIGTNGGLSKLTNKTFVNYTVKEGLAANMINNLVFDDAENLFIATSKGLSVLNNNTFKNYSVKDGLSNNVVLTLFRSRSNIIWIGTAEGLCYFKDGKITELKSKEFIREKINAIVEDNAGQLWVTTDKGVFLIVSDKIINQTNKINLQEPVTSLLKDRNGNVWLGTIGAGIIKYNGSVFKSYIIRNDLNSNLVSTIYQDREENVWIGTYSGLFKYRSDEFVTFSENDGLSSSFIYQIMRDHTGTMWVGTKLGIHKYANSRFNLQTLPGAKIGTTISAIIEDDNKNLWIGASDGLYKNIGAGSVKFTQKDGLIDNNILVVFKDKRNNLWIGGKGGVTNYDGHRFTKYKLAKDDEVCDVSAIYQDRQGNIWFGAYQGGLYKYDGKNIVDYRPVLNIGTSAFMAITQDRYNNMYFGTFDGVYIYDGKKVNVINEKDGLNSDLVYVMLLDDNDRTLWVGTNQGVNKIDAERIRNYGLKKIQTFGKQEGFSGVECNINGIFKDRDTSIWFGTVNGLVKYNPKSYKSNNYDAKTLITNVSLFDKDTLLRQNVKLPYNSNHLSFQFTGISLTAPYKVKYRYKLEGYDTYWSHVSNYNIASYTSLPPRKYIFKVYSCNSEGKWSSIPAEFKFTIESPWWRKPWFRLVLLAFIVGVVYLIFKLRLRSLRLKERNRLNQKIQVVKYELKALRAQMNPHFIFNSLNAIQHFIVKSDIDDASKYLNKFAKLIRMILNNSEKPNITVREEVDSLTLYLELEKLRFEKKFTYKVIIDKSVDEDFTEMPTMVLQPYVENAIIHGLTPKKEPGLLEISIKQANNFLICTIHDNGIGRAKSADLKKSHIASDIHNSMGMSITKGRLEMLNNLHNSNLSVVIHDLTENETKAGIGTRVEIFIPLD